jgi:hypothetical protein
MNARRARVDARSLYAGGAALANKRVQCNASGQVALKLKTPWCDGAAHQARSPLEFMQRLAATVPQARLPAPGCSCGVPGERLLCVDQCREPNVRRGSGFARPERELIALKLSSALPRQSDDPCRPYDVRQVYQFSFQGRSTTSNAQVDLCCR